MQGKVTDMSLMKQVGLLLAAVVLLALAGAVGVNLLSARDTLEAQLRVKNSDNAQSLALALSQQRGDAQLMELLMAAQFDTGFYRRVRLLRGDGSVAFEREAEVAAQRAPAWFAAAWPIASVPGVAQVSDGWRALGRVEVVSHVGLRARRVVARQRARGVVAGRDRRNGPVAGRSRRAAHPAPPRCHSGAGARAGRRPLCPGRRAACARVAARGAGDERHGAAREGADRGADRAGRIAAPPGSRRCVDRAGPPRPLHAAPGRPAARRGRRSKRRAGAGAPGGSGRHSTAGSAATSPTAPCVRSPTCCAAGPPPGHWPGA